MGIKVITPAAPAIAVAELRSHLRAPSTGPDDSLMLAYLAAATAHAQHYTGRSIGLQTLELALDSFPTGAIELLQGPVTSITSIKYIDTNGVEQTLSPSAYTLDDYNSVQDLVMSVYGSSWPSTQASSNAVKVRYVAGSLPDAVRSALLLLVGHFYENREDTAPTDVRSIPTGAKDLLDTVRIWSM